MLKNKLCITLLTFGTILAPTHLFAADETKWVNVGVNLATGGVILTALNHPQSPMFADTPPLRIAGNTIFVFAAASMKQNLSKDKQWLAPVLTGIVITAMPHIAKTLGCQAPSTTESVTALIQGIAAGTMVHYTDLQDLSQSQGQSK